MVKLSIIPGIQQTLGISLTLKLIPSLKLYELNNLELEN